MKAFAAPFLMGSDKGQATSGQSPRDCWLAGPRVTLGLGNQKQRSSGNTNKGVTTVTCCCLTWAQTHLLAVGNQVQKQREGPFRSGPQPAEQPGQRQGRDSLGTRCHPHGLQQQPQRAAVLLPREAHSDRCWREHRDG